MDHDWKVVLIIWAYARMTDWVAAVSTWWQALRWPHQNISGGQSTPDSYVSYLIFLCHSNIFEGMCLYAISV